MAELFISYSRKDKSFVQKLQEALKEANRDVWVDWQDIPPTAEWLKEIASAIDTTQAIVFVISPDSIASQTCNIELTYAHEHNKRLIPIVYRDVIDTGVPEPLARLNWIFFREQDDFAISLKSLITYADTDLDWVHTHTRLLVRAGEWDQKARDNSFLLRGNDLKEAEDWLGQGGQKQPQPTSLQTQYIVESRKGTTKRQRNILTGVIFALIVSIALGVLAYLNYRSETIAKQQAEERQNEALRSLGRIFTERAWQHVEKRDRFLGVKYALAGWRLAPSTAEDQRLVLASVLQETNEILAVLSHTSRPVKASFSPDGSRVVTTSEDGNVRLWDSHSGKQLGVFTGHELSTLDVSFSSDGKTILSTSDDASARLWDSTSPHDTGTLLEHRLPVTLATFSPDGRQVATISEMTRLSTKSFEVWLWNTSGGKEIWSASLSSSGLAVGFTIDGKGIVTIDTTGTADFWDRRTGHRYGKRTFGTGEHSTAALDLANGLVILAAGDSAQVYRYSTGTLIADLRGNNGDIFGVAIAQSGRTVATGAADGSARLWDVESGRSVGSLVGHEGKVVDVAFTVDGTRVLTVSDDKTVRVWKASRTVAELDGEGDTRLAFSRDGSRLVRTSGAGLEIIEVPSFSVLNRQALRTTVVSSIAHGKLEFSHKESHAVSFTVDASRVLTVNGDGEIWSYDVKGGLGSVVYRLGAPLFAAALAPEAPLAALVSFDTPNRVILVDTVTGVWRYLPGEAHSQVLEPSFSRDGSRLAAASQNGWVSVWDTATLEQLMRRDEQPSSSGTVVLKLEGTMVGTIALSDDGKLVAISLRDGTCHIMDIAANKDLVVFGGSADFAISAMFSRDSRLLVTGGSEGTRVWDVRTGQMLARFEKATSAVAFTPDSLHIVVGSGSFVYSKGYKNQVRTSSRTEVWDVRCISQPIEKLAAITCASFLGSQMHKFSDQEIAADPNLREVLMATETDAGVCPR